MTILTPEQLQPNLQNTNRPTTGSLGIYISNKYDEHTWEMRAKAGYRDSQYIKMYVSELSEQFQSQNVCFPCEEDFDGFLNVSSFNPNNPIKILFHGFSDNGDTLWTRVSKRKDGQKMYGLERRKKINMG